MRNISSKHFAKKWFKLFFVKEMKNTFQNYQKMQKL